MLISGLIIPSCGHYWDFLIDWIGAYISMTLQIRIVAAQVISVHCSSVFDLRSLFMCRHVSHFFTMGLNFLVHWCHVAIHRPFLNSYATQMAQNDVFISIVLYGDSRNEIDPESVMIKELNPMVSQHSPDAESSISMLIDSGKGGSGFSRRNLRYFRI